MTLRNLALALSGGGTRASTFHMGVLLRLAKSGSLESVGAISTVSGGSLAIALVFSLAENRWPSSKEFVETVYPQAIKTLVTKSLQGSSWKRTLSRPWMLFTSRGNLFAEALRSTWGIKGSLKTLPAEPLWMINATCYETGRNWRFSRARIGDWRFGINEVQDVDIADAAAASAAIPYMAGFLKLPIAPNNWRAIDPATDVPVSAIVPPARQVRLWDGGVYENLGIEAVYKPGRGFTVPGIDSLVVSDASSQFPEDYGIASGIFMARSPFLRAPRLYEIATEQTRALRSRMLMDAVTARGLKASIVRMGRSSGFIDRASKCPNPLPAEDVLSDDVVRALASFPTNGGAIESATCNMLARHGFETADATLCGYQQSTYPVRITWPAILA